MSLLRIDNAVIWSWFQGLLSPGEATAFGKMMRALSKTELDTVFDDYLVPGLFLAKGASAPDLAEFRDGLFLNAFAGTAGVTEQLFFSVHILHGILPNSVPTFHIHWSHNIAVPSGDVKWQIDYTIVKGYGVSQYPAPTTITTTQTAGAQYTHQITDDDDMPVSGEIEPDSVLIGRIYRDPTDSADTFEDDAFLIQADIHYERTRLGTVERNRPFAGFG